MFPIELQAARLRLVKERWYLSSALWRLHPVERPGLGTMAVDQWWRLYFDPAVVQEWSVEEMEGVLYHEVTHLLRDHPGRGQFVEDPGEWNLDCDAEINDDLEKEGVRLPGQPVTPALLGLPEGLLAEEYYAARKSQAQRPAPGQGAPAKPQGGGKPEAGDTCQGDGAEAGREGKGSPADASGATAQDTVPSTAPGGGEGDGSSPSPTGGGGTQAGGAQPGDRGDAQAQEAGDAGGPKAGDGVGSIPTSSSGQPPVSPARAGVSSQPPAGPVGSGITGGANGRPPGDRAQAPAPGAGRCGSCATGRQEPWEEGPPGKCTTPGVTRTEAEIIRREVARQIIEASRSWGNIPGHWRRWAEEKLSPKIDWRRELAAAVRHALADVAGASDYTYRRPSRRQGQISNGKVIFPALHRPVPQVAVVVDTSGSVSDGMLSQALAEVAGVIKACGQREGVHVLAVDTTVQACRRAFRPEQVELAGGGGTDMGAGLAAAVKLQPRPQVVVVLTDGYTPWPPEPPQGVKIIVGLLGDGQSPGWAKTIKVERR